MPVVTPDQGLTLPIQADAANEQTAMANYNTGVEPRLVHYYVDAADRTARNPTPPAGQLSWLTTPGRWDRYTGTAWHEAFPLFVRKPTETQVVNNSTTLVNDDALFFPLQTNGRYLVEFWFMWDSGTTADIKIGWTVPAGASIPKWSIVGPDTGVVFSQAFSTTGSSLARGGNGIGSFQMGFGQVNVVTAGTAGNFQMQWAQNALEAVNTRIKQDSWIRGLRVG